MSGCEVELFIDAKAVIGESPIWVKQQNALYWIDIKAPKLYRTEFASRATKSWDLPSDIGGYALMPDLAGAILALRSGIFLLQFSDGELHKLCDPPFDPFSHRFNEGDCDPAGRLWLGTMFDPIKGAHAEPAKGYLYSFTLADGLQEHDDSSLLHNGFAWSGNARQFFSAHSREGRIYAQEFDVATGERGSKRVVAEIPQELGIPDGGAFDEEGYYWSAIHGGGRLHRYAPDGDLDRVVHLPIQNPTMVAFCGPGLTDLCITSATHGKPCKPLEGGIFICKPGIKGLLREHFVA